MPRVPSESSMRRFVHHPLPLITSRIRFVLADHPALAPPPTITPRINFTADVVEPGPGTEYRPPASNVRFNPNPEVEHHTPSTRDDQQSKVETPLSDGNTSKSDPELTDLSDSDEEMDDQEDELASDTRISKPSGEPGRPDSGGHNLVQSLSGWPPAFLEEVKVYVRQLASKHLNEDVSYSKQDKEEIKLVCQLAAEKFPILDKYNGSWPVLDILKARLKYTARRYKQRLNAKANSEDDEGNDRDEEDDPSPVVKKSAQAAKKPAKAVKKAVKPPTNKSGGRALRSGR